MHSEVKNSLMLCSPTTLSNLQPDKTDHRLPELVKYLYVEDKGVNNAKGTHSRFALIKKEGGDILANESALCGKCASGTRLSTPTIQIENPDFFDLRNKLDAVKSGKKMADIFNTRLCLTFAEAFWLP